MVGNFKECMNAYFLEVGSYIEIIIDISLEVGSYKETRGRQISIDGRKMVSHPYLYEMSLIFFCYIVLPI